MSRYGSSANLVLTTGQGVNGYTLDSSLGEFILTHPNVSLLLRLLRRSSRLTCSPPGQIRIPSRGKIYSFNEGNSLYFHEPVKQYLESIKYPSEESGKKPYSARYIGSMVSLHRCSLSETLTDTSWFRSLSVSAILQVDPRTSAHVCLFRTSTEHFFTEASSGELLTVFPRGLAVHPLNPSISFQLPVRQEDQDRQAASSLRGLP